MYLVKTPGLIQTIFAGLTWRMANSEHVYLTFDDGPIPEVTPWVLDLLKTEEVKATFFCVGDNVEKHPEIYDRILEEGHSVGNHTYNHLNAWKTSSESYRTNVEKASRVIDSKLFRPPYGKLSPGVIKQLKKEYDVIMWDVLSGDFDVALSPEECLRNVTKNAKKGSIVVFHDSEKAFEKLRYVLSGVIAFFKEKGIPMDKITM